MAAEVRLTITQGISTGKVFVFRERTIGAVGRSDECLLRLPNAFAIQDVSRRHCLLDIDPPSIRVRDLGSRNGTYVNGEKIGQRERGLPPELAAASQLPEHRLGVGDELRVGSIVFRIDISHDYAAHDTQQITAVGGVPVG